MPEKRKISHDVPVEVRSLWDKMRASGVGGKDHGRLLAACVLMAHHKPLELLEMRGNLAKAEEMDCVGELIVSLRQPEGEKAAPPPAGMKAEVDGPALQAAEERKKRLRGQKG